MKKIFIFIFCLISTYIFSQEQASFFFESNISELKKNELEKLNKWLDSNKDSKILGIYGFCDEIGTVGYNDTLAKKRINFVVNQIEGKIKTRDDFKTRSFGELHTMSKIQAENRKVSLYYILPKDFSKEEEIIGNKKTEKKVVFLKKMKLELPDGKFNEMELDTVFMKKLYSAKVGEKLVLKNLNFYINTFAVMKESMTKMQELLFVMQMNPDLVIQIQGHLCCVSKDIRDLGTLRARAIYKFLEINGIEKSRMSYIGFGSTQPIFSIPEKSEEEREANRRVEILIINNKDH